MKAFIQKSNFINLKSLSYLSMINMNVTSKRISNYNNSIYNSSFYCFSKNPKIKTSNSKKLSHSANILEAMDTSANRLKEPKLFKLTFSGLDKAHSADDIKKVLSLVNEIIVIRIDKQKKMNFCHTNVKSFLEAEDLKSKFDNLKITNKLVKVRVKEIDTLYESVNSDISEKNTSIELTSKSKIDSYLDGIIIKQQSSIKAENIEYLYTLKQHFNERNVNEANDEAELINTNRDRKEFNKEILPNYVEFEWGVCHICQKDLASHKILKKHKESDKNENLFFISDIKTYSSLNNYNIAINDDDSLNSQLIEKEYKKAYEYYYELNKISNYCKSQFKNLIQSLNFTPYLDEVGTIWKGLKLQILNSSDKDNQNTSNKVNKNIVITIMINPERMSLNDISIIKQAFMLKFKKENFIGYSLNFFFAINAKINSSVIESTKFIDFDDVMLYNSLERKLNSFILQEKERIKNKEITEDIQSPSENLKSMKNIEEGHLNTQKCLINENHDKINDRNYFNNKEYTIIPWRKVDNINIICNQKDLLSLIDFNSISKNKDSKLKIKSKEVILFTGNCQLLKNNKDSLSISDDFHIKLVEKIFNNRDFLIHQHEALNQKQTSNDAIHKYISYLNQTKQTKKEKENENKGDKDTTTPEVVISNDSIILINIHELLKRKDFQIDIKNDLQISEYHILYSNSIIELIEFTKFYSNRKLKFEVINSAMFSNKLIDYKLFVMVIKRIV